MKKIINILLSFFMAVIIFVFSCCAIGAFLTSAPFIKGAVFVSAYTKNAETEIAESLQSVAIPSGLPENFFDDKIHTIFIKNTINNCISSAIKGKAYEMPTAEIEALIYNDILKYSKENGIQMDEEAETMLKNTASLSATYYKNFTYNIFYRVLKFLKGISLKMLIAAVVLLAVLAFMHYLLKGKKELCFAYLGGGTMLFAPIILIISGVAFKWAIASKAVLTFVNLYIGFTLITMVILGVLAILYGIKKSKEIIK